MVKKFSKKFVREQSIDFLNKLIPTKEKNKSKLIVEKLLNLKEFKNSKNVMVYVSKKSEVDTRKMIKKLLNTRKMIVVPKIVKNNIIPFKLNSFDDLSIGKFSILEPQTVKKVEKSDIDIFIIPGLAFDLLGNRVGYGYGYWDKFLSDVDKKCIIGLAFQGQVFDKIQNKKHDISVSKIITEKRVILCKSYGR